MTDEERNGVENSAVEHAMATLNRDSIRDKGRPFVVGVRINGEMVYRKYDALTEEEITEFRRQGIIL